MNNSIPQNVKQKCIQLEKIMEDSGYVFVRENSKDYKKYKKGINYNNGYLVGIFVGEDENTKEKYYCFEQFIYAKNDEQAIEIFNERNGFNHENTKIICSFLNKGYCSVLKIN